MQVGSKRLVERVRLRTIFAGRRTTDSTDILERAEGAVLVTSAAVAGKSLPRNPSEKIG